MRHLIVLLIGALLGAAAFHLYYLRLTPPARCGWDHPLDAGARADCRTAATATSLHGYAVKARRDLDSLIGTVSRWTLSRRRADRWRGGGARFRSSSRR